MSLAPSRLDRARSMPLHILRIRCWGFGPKDCIPTFAFFLLGRLVICCVQRALISPWRLQQVGQLGVIRRDPPRLVARHFGFSFVDNNTATSCCHGSVLYSGSIFCEM